MDMSVIKQSLRDADTDKDTAISRGTVKPDITLDSHGDVVLAVSESISGLKKEFLVSSTVLCLASDYFKTLLTSDFKEACQLRTEVCPTITMEDDDVDAMLVVLSIMHFKHQASWCHEFTAEKIASIAVLCDKYDFIEALRPWIAAWLTVTTDTSVGDLGVLLLAAYLFRSANALETISAAAIHRVSLQAVEAWPKQNFVGLLPDDIMGS